MDLDRMFLKISFMQRLLDSDFSILFNIDDEQREIIQLHNKIKIKAEPTLTERFDDFIHEGKLVLGLVYLLREKDRKDSQLLNITLSILDSYIKIRTKVREAYVKSNFNNLHLVMEFELEDDSDEDNPDRYRIIHVENNIRNNHNDYLHYTNSYLSMFENIKMITIQLWGQAKMFFKKRTLIYSQMISYHKRTSKFLRRNVQYRSSTKLRRMKHPNCRKYALLHKFLTCIAREIKRNKDYLS